MTSSRIYYKKVRVKVPATTSNLGPGFDILGMALNLHNEVEVEMGFSSPPKNYHLTVDIEGEGKSTLPHNEKNMIVQAAHAIVSPAEIPADEPLSHLPFSLRFKMKNRIPLARGLGSSAAARLAGVLAMYTLYYDVPAKNIKERLEEEALPVALRMEGHPDNLLPAFHGGLCGALQDGGQLRYLPIAVPKDLVAVLCVPDFELSTEKARKVLPENILRKDMVATAARVAFLVGAFEQKRYDWLKFAMQDTVHQPYRRPLIPGMQGVIDEAVKAGAYGAALSGSGPSIFAFAPRGPRGPVIGRAMQKAFLKYRIESKYHVLEIDRKGASIEFIK